MSSTITLEECTRRLIKEYFLYLENLDDAIDLHKFVLAQVEKPLIEETLKQAKGNKLQTAKILGINRNTLHKKMNYFNISKDLK